MLPRPIPKEPAPWAFPTPQERALDNGARLLVYPVPGQHVISTRVVIPAPLSSEPRDREGVATLVSRTMDEGTEQRTGEEMAELLERNGVGLAAAATEGGIVMEVEATRPQLSTGLELLTECLSQPVFDQGEVRRHQRQRLADIEQALARPASRAALEWIATKYAPAARASRPSGGGAETVAAITRDDLAAFHRDHVGPRGVTVVVAGDIDVDEATADVARTLGSWGAESGSAATEPADNPTAADAARIVFVDRPGSVQTEIYLGASGPSRRVPGGWAPYPALAYLLGGSPSSRIDALLREEKGYTYGMRATFRPRLRGGEVLVSGSVRGDVTAESLDLLLGVLDGAAADGFTAEEVKAAVDFVGKTAPARYATADVIADEAAHLAFDGLGTSFVTDYLEGLRSLDPERLQRDWAAVAHDWTVVLVGDADAAAEQVRALGRGDVTVVS